MSKLVGDTCEFGETQHFVAGDVANRNIAPHRQEMVFTQREDTHARNADHLICRDRIETCISCARIVLDKFTPPVSPSTWRILQSFSVRIFTYCNQQFASQFK